ncbi:hypothetical protein LCGC14_0527360 [marine sediment metagenome]|uniref:Uncharacterized protein n=1 Tax=marine sediment metagenome TaxID=412755 RepID=A0A0F9RWT8_9ZZZZ
MTISEQAKEGIERSGYGISGDIGGIGRQTYFTPDGRKMRAIPAIRDYVVKQDGKVIESGTRDANYDKGWLPVMPTELKPHCDGCDNWHDTQEEVDACILGKKTKAAEWEKWAKERQQGEAMEAAKETEELRTEFLELKGDVHSLIEQNKELMKLLEAKK